MKSLPLVLSLLTLGVPSAALAQSFHTINKYQNFVQRSASGATADPVMPFAFQARSAANVTLTLPGGSTMALSYNTEDSVYMLRQNFATKAALDAAYPNGTYRLAGGGLASVTINLPADNYPAMTPQVVSVVNGAWSSGGMLVVDPAQAATLNFSTFTGYATSGMAGHMNFVVEGMSDQVSLSQDIISQPMPGLTLQAAPFTSFTIPARTLTSGRVYRAWLDFDTITVADFTSVPGSIVASLFSKELLVYIVAQTPGTTAPVAPVITNPPASQVGVIGGSVTFAVAGNFGTNPGEQIFFEWSRNGRALGNPATSGGKYTSTGSTWTINNLTAADAGDYVVNIVSSGGFVTSPVATLSFAAASAPAISTQPRSATVNAGSTVALTVTATGTPTPRYEWRKDGIAILGGTTDTLMLTNVTTTAAGNYTVFVSNSAGSVTSSVATLAVTSGQPSRLPNLSVRTSLAASQTLFVGFGTTGTKTMLVRGVGPSLAVFGLSGVLPDPLIELYNSASAKIDENNDWSASLASVFNDVGAFGLTAGSKDAALRRDCTGSYTAQIKSSGSGVVLVEVYDSGGTGKLTNVSARNAVGTGDNILIAGFVVDGNAAKTLLIRGVGPKLAEFGVAGVLADPKLEIYTTAGVKIAENDSWSALLQPVARSVGAFDLTLGSRDAALLITLPPGGYTAQISGLNGGTGEAIVEVYEVP